MTALRIPAATYRLQFNQHLCLADARKLAPYLEALGITDLYASPLLQARRDSTHGYDVTDPSCISQGLGGTESFNALVETLRQYNMGLLLDIVPNHMAASSENPWWRDVLQNGPDSPYASFFDIDWHPERPGLNNKVMAPFLGSPYGQALENQELRLVLAEDGFWICYHEFRFPLNPASVKRLQADLLEWMGLRERSAPPLTLGAIEKDPKLRAAVNSFIKTINGCKGDPQSFDLLDGLLGEQCYRLSLWQAAHRGINYRRFFNVNELVAVCVEKEDVFQATHRLVLELARAGQVDGLRIDHIDGLYDPYTYLCRLQGQLSPSVPNATPPGFFVVVEKILGRDEALPGNWPVNGTTGYDFLKAVNELFVYGPGLEIIDETYKRLSGSEADFSKVVYARKRQLMQELFGGEARALLHGLGQLAERDRYGHDLTLFQLEQALLEVTACLPVYRTYIRDGRVAARDRESIENAFDAARKRHPAANPAFDFLRRVLLLEFPASFSTDQKGAWIHFVQRWQQFSGPIMAKGYEDTALYIYNRLISLNEVGNEPQATRFSVEEFHHHNLVRQATWPHSLNSTSTHDTKRSEDVRARINVLSEIPEIWIAYLDRWQKWNRGRRVRQDGRLIPDGNVELLIYQTLLGAWPLREEEIPGFMERFENYLVKSAREAKMYTRWLQPNPSYEQALIGFTEAILEPAASNRFLPDFLRLQKKVAYYGALGSLAQVLMKITAPGVPDFYQGTETWNFSLVDPDNRRPVDFRELAALLALLQHHGGSGADLLREMLASWADGRLKLFLTYKALHFRREHRQLFASGSYVPLAATGPLSGHVCAFARRDAETWAVVVVPRFSARLQLLRYQPPVLPSHESGHLPEPIPPLGQGVWGENLLVLPPDTPGRWKNLFTGERLSTLTSGAAGPELSLGSDFPAGSKFLPLSDVFNLFPAALLSP